jgi:tetratricopeptide (TPR) repeat protein
MRGLTDGTVRFEKDDVINSKILPAYSRMLTNRGRYLALSNQYEGAVAAFKEALTLDPNLAEARKGFVESEAKLRKP